MTARKKKTTIEEELSELREGGPQRISVDIPAELVREMKNAIYEAPPRLTGGGPSAFIARSVLGYLRELRTELNKGKPFDSRTEPRMSRGPRPK